MRPLPLCPHPALRRRRELPGFLAADRTATRRVAAGEGIPAPQIGVPPRMVAATARKPMMVLCDADLLRLPGPRLRGTERCLPRGGQVCHEQADRVTIGWSDMDGVLERVFQRQLDLLPGRFIRGF